MCARLDDHPRSSSFLLCADFPRSWETHGHGFQGDLDTDITSKTITFDLNHPERTKTTLKWHWPVPLKPPIPSLLLAQIEASYLEIYNERMFDLLDDVSNEVLRSAAGSVGSSLFCAFECMHYARTAIFLHQLRLLTHMAQNQKGDYQIIDDPALGTHVKGMTRVRFQSLWVLFYFSTRSS